MTNEEFWELIGRVVDDYHARDPYYEDPDWLQSLDLALQAQTGRRLITKSLWEETLAKLAETDDDKDPEPVKVVVKVARDGKVTCQKPDHVEVEYRDYNHGSDCGQCGKYIRSYDLVELNTRFRGQHKDKQRVCKDCYNSVYVSLLSKKDAGE